MKSLSISIPCLVQLFTVLLFAAIPLGCGNEDKVDPSTSNTFFRYFSGGNNDDAVQVVQTADDGYLILANSEVSELGPNNSSVYKIKLIKTDAAGNVMWQKLYPPDFTSNIMSFRGQSIKLSSSGGIVITGWSDIDPSINRPKLLLLKTDDNGVIQDTTSLQANDVRGAAVAEASTGNILLAADIIVSGNNPNISIGATEVNKSQISQVVWQRGYGAGTSDLSNKMFVQEDRYFLAGTVQRAGQSDIRFLKSGPNSNQVDFDLPLGTPNANETCQDFTPFGFGYALAGSTDEAGPNDRDMLYLRVTEAGQLLNRKTFRVSETPQNEVANSITVAQDGNLVMLGTFESQGDIGQGETDYFLVKFDPTGNETWRKTYGSKFVDKGASIIQSRDGGLIVLGTTTLANIRTVALMKLDENGSID